MKLNKKKLVLFLFVCSCSLLPTGLFSQSYIINYDYLTKNQTILKLTDKGDTVKITKQSYTFKPNHTINFKIQNFNNNALTCQVLMIKEEGKDTTLKSEFGNFKSNITGALSGNLFQSIGFDISSIFRGEEELSLEQLNKQLLDLQNQLQNTKKYLAELKELRYNTTLPGDQIKERARELVSKLGSPLAPEPSMDVEFWNEVNNLALKKLSDFKVNASLYQAKAASLNTGTSNGVAMRGVVNENAETFQDFVLLNTADSVSRVINELSLEYKSIINQTFENTFSLTPEKSISKVQIRVAKVKMPNDTLEAPFVEERFFKLRDVSKFGLSTTVGIGFLRFVKPEMKYDLQNDSVIVESNGSYALPAISTFLNFYGKISPVFGLGGTFGISIPFQDGRGISFVLGPSIVLGKNSLVVLSGGLMLGKANRIDKGYSNGDILLPEDRDIPIKSTYNLGYYLGLSFNLAGLNLK